MRRKGNQSKRADEKARNQIGEAGWDLTRVREQEHGHGRFVARQRVIEDDHSITLRYESSLTLDGLAKNVQRRVRELA